MATSKKNEARPLQDFMKHPLVDAQKRLQAFETEAQKVLENLVERGQKSRKEVEALLTRFNGLEQLRGGIDQLRDLNPLDPKAVKSFRKKANQARTDVEKRINSLQARVVETVGVASQAQVREINRELVKLSKKLDALNGTGKKAGTKPEARS